MELESTVATKKPFEVKYPTTYAGAFSKIYENGSQDSWQSCREVFAASFTRKCETFLFSHKPNTTAAIQAFFSKIENILKLKKNRTVVIPTTKANISYIQVPDWWRKYLIRRSLFTILLRSGQNYKPQIDNFEQALYSDRYANETKEALAAFLSGNTFCKRASIHSGWRNTFSQQNANFVKGVLMRPPQKQVVELKDDSDVVEL
jgi:hypothetical protein